MFQGLVNWQTVLFNVFSCIQASFLLYFNFNVDLSDYAIILSSNDYRCRVFLPTSFLFFGFVSHKDLYMNAVVPL